MKKSPFFKNWRVLFPALLVFLGAPATVLALQPHQARYQLDVAEIRMPGVEGAETGLYAIQVERLCDGWTLLTQLEVPFVLEDGRPLKFTASSSSTESFDGRRLSFSGVQMVNDAPIQEENGQAVLNGDQGGDAFFDGADPNEDPVLVALPMGARFPISAFQDTIAQIASGKKVVEYTLFDGSRQSALGGTDIVIGEARPLQQTPSGDVDLIQGPGYRVTSSYYELTAKDAEPISSATVDVYVNGIMTALSFDLGIALVDGVLTSVSALPEPTC